MSSFFVVLFGKNRYIQYKISELLDNSFNGIVNEEYAFCGIRFYFPVIKENSNYYIDCGNSSDQKWKFAINGEEIKEKRELKNGDYLTISNEESKIALLVHSYESSSLSANVYELIRGTSYLIGRVSDANIVIDSSPAVSRKHASIRIESDGTAMIEDLSSTTGVYVNGKKVKSKKLSNGDHIFIMGYTFIIYGTSIIIPAGARVNGIQLKNSFPTYRSDKESHIQFVRSPRIQKGVEKRIIEIDPPTAEQKQKEMPFILTAGPSLTMSLAMLASVGVTVSNMVGGKGYASVITSGVMAVSMLIGALVWPKLTRNYTAKQLKMSEEQRQLRYRDYLKAKNNEIEEAYNKNRKIWNEELYPNIEGLSNIVRSRNHNLWARSIRDEDFLTIRLGTGNRPFEVEISTKKKGFELEDDILRDESYKIADKYAELKDVPITLSLKEHKVVGVFGDYKEMARSFIINLITLYSPDEVKIVLVYNHNQANALSVFNDLPHTWSSDRTRRLVANTVEEAHTLFGELEITINSREDSLNEKDIRIPHYVILAFDKLIIDSVPFRKSLLNEKINKGISSIFFGERFNQIPQECDTVIIVEENGNCGLYIKNENNNDLVDFACDYVSKEIARSIVEEINRIEIKEEKSFSDVPERVSFLDVYQAGNVDSLNIVSHWNSNNSNNSLAAPIGISGGGNRFYLDIHEKYHGCHGLVAGTTGSGKSEMLQAYILSMMINYSPNDVAFVLVDFKGGDMARPFMRSPHLAATISNLSGNILYRALVSLEAEIKKRQTIFNDAAYGLGIDKIDINSYQRLFKENRLSRPLPHLIIVIDEFAQLKMQHPEFMEKLIEIAQVGRSLGIHLILATQKPSGVVDPQIWSNSRFRICLKVMDKQDSLDMINRQAAALIKNPGRAYVQIGYDEIFELVQAGYSGADYVPRDRFINDDSITVSMVNGPAEIIREARDVEKGIKTNLTQLEAIMREIENVGKTMAIKAEKLWQDPLPEKLTIEELEKDNNESYGTIVCGLIDLPHLQAQSNYYIDFIKEGHLAIYGSAGMGKTTAIQTICYMMALNNSPEYFNHILIDCNGGSLVNLSKMPHCVAYTTEENESKTASVLEKIGEMITERRRRFNETNCGNYEAYIKAGNKDMPLVLVIIDNYSTFRERMYRCEDLLVQYIAPSSSCGIYFIITGASKSAIYYKVTDQISNKIVLSMNDQGSYYDLLNMKVPIYPENIKGRALVIKDKSVAELQIAVPFDASSDVERMQKLNEFCVEEGKIHRKMEIDIKDANDNEFEDENEIESTPIYQAKIPNKVNVIDRDAAFLTVKRISDETKIGIFPTDHNPRLFIANPVYYENLITNIIDQMNSRGLRTKLYSAESIIGVDDELYIPDIEGFVDDYREDDSVLIINGFSDFFDTISDDALEGFIKIIKETGDKRIITIDDMERLNMYRSTELYILLVRDVSGMVIGGNVDDSMAIGLNNDFYRLPEKYRNVVLDKNQAVVYENDTYEYVEL